MSLKSLLSAGALVTVGMFTGRFLGLLREMFIAANYGSGHEADIAIALLIMPDFVTATLVGNAVSAVLVPAFATRTPEQRTRLFWQSFLSSILLFAFVACLAALFVPEGTFQRVWFIALASLPIIAGTSVFTAYLQHTHRFTIPAFSNAIFNVVILLTLWFFPTALTLLALAIIVAALLRFFVHGVAYARAGGSGNATLVPWELNRNVLTAYYHTTASSILGILPQFIPYVIVALLTSGSFALFNYAYKLVFFPAVMIQTVIQMALLPWFVKMLADAASTAQNYRNSLHIGWLMSVAVALCTSLAAHPIAELCFGYGKMTDADISTIAHLLAIGVWATPGAVLSIIWQQIFFTQQHPKPVLKANAMLAILLVTSGVIGHEIAGQEGVLVAFVLVQLIPAIILAKTGRHYVDSWGMPSKDITIAMIATVLCFLPLAWLYMAFAAGAILGVTLAIIIGMVCLSVGLLCYPPVTEKLRAYVKDHHHHQ